MRGFTERPSKRVTFKRGTETITYTVHALPALFMGLVRLKIPYTGDESEGALEMQALILTAEGLRTTEEIPPHPEPAASSEEWRSYARTLSEMFSAAGLSSGQITRLGRAVTELDTFVSEALEETGND